MSNSYSAIFGIKEHSSSASQVPTRIIVHIFGCFILMGALGLKCSRTNGNTFGIYYTTWMWILVCFFFAVVIVPLTDKSYWEYFAAALLFLVVGVCFMVYILYCAIILSNPVPMAVMQDQLGVATVFVGEKVTHALPLLCVLVFLIFNIDIISQCCTKAWVTKWTKKWQRALLLFYWYSGPLIMSFVYSVHSPWQVYHSKLTYAESVAVVCCCLLVTQPLLWLAIFRRGRSQSLPSKTDDPTEGTLNAQVQIGWNRSSGLSV